MKPRPWVLEGLLYIETKAEGSGNAELLIVAPASVRKDVMRMAHDIITAVHSGRHKTIACSASCLSGRDGGGRSQVVRGMRPVCYEESRPR